MKKLSAHGFEQSYRYIMDVARPFEAALCAHYFIQTCPELVITELAKFQNDDGGFGHGLEPDFQLPDSSPMATTIAFQWLTKFDEHPAAQQMIKAGVEYFEATYQPARNGWQAVPPAVNNHPHTPWWHFNADKEGSIIDENWGNPSAEIIGYLYKYREHVKTLEIEQLLATAFDHLNNKESNDFHEIYCYIRLHDLLPEDLAVHIRPRITQAVQQLISASPKEWEHDYQPKPMDFIGESQQRFGITDELLELNYEYAVTKLEQNQLILPSWGKNFYIDGLESSWNQWLGILTLQTLKFLHDNDRIDV